MRNFYENVKKIAREILKKLLCYFVVTTNFEEILENFQKNS